MKRVSRSINGKAEALLRLAGATPSEPEGLARVVRRPTGDVRRGGGRPGSGRCGAALSRPAGSTAATILGLAKRESVPPTGLGYPARISTTGEDPATPGSVAAENGVPEAAP